MCPHPSCSWPSNSPHHLQEHFPKLAWPFRSRLSSTRPPLQLQIPALPTWAQTPQSPNTSLPFSRRYCFVLPYPSSPEAPAEIAPPLHPSVVSAMVLYFYLLSPNTESQGAKQWGNRVLHEVSHQVQGCPCPEVHVRGWRPGHLWLLQVTPRLSGGWGKRRLQSSAGFSP